MNNEADYCHHCGGYQAGRCPFAPTTRPRTVPLPDSSKRLQPERLAAKTAAPSRILLLFVMWFIEIVFFYTP